MKNSAKLVINPLVFPLPLTFHYVAGRQKVLKHLGVSPSIDNGIRYWRVIWRPFLPKPVPYRDQFGRWQLKRKADSVKTERYPIVGEHSEEELFRLAVVKACEVYRIPVEHLDVTPRVDWEMLAKATGQRVRSRYSKPSLNEGVMQRAMRMFDQGASNSMVAKAMGVDRSTASRWRKKAHSS